MVVDFGMAVRNSKGEVIGLPMGYQALDDLVREKRGDHIIAQVSDLVSRYRSLREIENTMSRNSNRTIKALLILLSLCLFGQRAGGWIQEGTKLPQ